VKEAVKLPPILPPLPAGDVDDVEEAAGAVDDDDDDDSSAWTTTLISSLAPTTCSASFWPPTAAPLPDLSGVEGDDVVEAGAGAVDEEDWPTPSFETADEEGDAEAEVLDDNNDAGTPPLPALLPGLPTTTSPLSALLSSASQSSCSSYWSLEEITMSAAPNACNDNASNDTLILAKPCPWWCA